MKFQMVVDPLIEDCLVALPGRNKTDKIRWALCVYREWERFLKQPNITDFNGREAMEELMARATTRYRSFGHGKKS